MTQPYSEMIAQLQHLSEILGPPLEHMRALSTADMHVSIAEAKGGVQRAMGVVPLPMHHPDYQALSNAMMNAAGMVDQTGDAWNWVVAGAGDAAAALEQTRGKIAEVITNFNAGS